MSFDLDRYEIEAETVIRNAAPARLYEDAIIKEGGRRVERRDSRPLGQKPAAAPPTNGSSIIRQHRPNLVGPVNIKLDEQIFIINRQRAIDYLNTRETAVRVRRLRRLGPRYRLKIRVICARAYHALFMHNMLIRPTAEELADFGEPDYVIYNAGQFPANPHTHANDVETSIDMSFERREYVILGTEYAGEMKKGVFTLMHYLMPEQGVLSMHCSANEGPPATCRCSSASRGPARRRFRPIRPPADRRRRTLLERRRRVQYRRGLLRQVHPPLGRERAGDFPGDPLRHRAGKHGSRPRHARGRFRRAPRSPRTPEPPTRSNSFPTPRFPASAAIRGTSFS